MRFSRLLALLPFTALAACAPDAAPGDPEEVPRTKDEVPAEVRVTAARIAERLGGSVGEWFWDTESEDWECALLGLPRQAELDVRPDGAFLELELVFDFAEVQAALPDVADFLERQCRGSAGTFIELSLRREELLEPSPELATVWKASGVVLECQCANGRDFEVDARNLVLEDKDDDVGVQGAGR